MVKKNGFYYGVEKLSAALKEKAETFQGKRPPGTVERAHSLQIVLGERCIQSSPLRLTGF